jgi:hypothetical protein
MQYLIEHFLRQGALAKCQTIDGEVYFEFGDHVLDGRINAQGEDDADTWVLCVRDNNVESQSALPPELLGFM